MEFYYVNSKGEKLDFTEHPYIAKDIKSLVNHGWGYTKSDGHIVGFDKDISEIPLQINVVGDTQEEFIQAANRFLDVIDYDIVNNQSGTLYFNEQYLEGFFKENQKNDWCKDIPFYIAKLVFLTERPDWILEKYMEFLPQTILSTSGSLKTYPYTYPYIYPDEPQPQYIDNDHYAAADFQMIVFGERSRTYITIGENIYHVEYPISKGEYMVIDSRDTAKTDERVYLVKNNGERISLFDYRDPSHSIFAKVPAGKSVIDIDGAGVNIILYQKRSEPKWT